METGVVLEYMAHCSKCLWHGRKYGNKANANAEADLHKTNFKHEDVEVIEESIDNNKVANTQMSEHEAKLLFIRKSAQEAFEKGEILEATRTILKTIVEVSLVSNMTKEEIGVHIGKLEQARSYLAAFTQGLQIGYAKEQEPIFRAKREKERRERLASKLVSSKDKKVNELIEMARNLASNPTGEITPKPVLTKQVCEKCNKEVFSLKYHTC